MTQPSNQPCARVCAIPDSFLKALAADFAFDSSVSAAISPELGRFFSLLQFFPGLTGCRDWIFLFVGWDDRDAAV
jgi:hypothetical protein